MLKEQPKKRRAFHNNMDFFTQKELRQTFENTYIKIWYSTDSYESQIQDSDL